MATSPQRRSAPTDAQRRANVGTALALASIAVVFFFGFMVARYLGDGETGMTVLALIAFIFLGLGIGRHLWRANK
ncbi:MAG: hypothetical protein IT522_08555 [Burkholderiales bacterium]|nr:hypothetical protein [Burkholderiales bacterium]